MFWPTQFQSSWQILISDQLSNPKQGNKFGMLCQNAQTLGICHWPRFNDTDQDDTNFPTKLRDKWNYLILHIVAEGERRHNCGNIINFPACIFLRNKEILSHIFICYLFLYKIKTIDCSLSKYSYFIRMRNKKLLKQLYINV